MAYKKNCGRREPSKCESSIKASLAGAKEQGLHDDR